jgi:hypothetical protein
MSFLRRELILARLTVVVGGISGIETSGRNLDRVADTKLPAAIVFDGDEDTVDNPNATGSAPNVAVMTPVVVVSLGDVPENIGTVTNQWLAKVQKAVLFDSEIEMMCSGTASGRRRDRRGARYLNHTNSLHEGRSSQLDLNVFFTVAYPFIPSEL